LPRLPVISANKAIKALEHIGFKIYRQTGSHIHLWNEQRNLVVTVPNHQELAKRTFTSIMMQARVEKKEFIVALRIRTTSRTWSEPFTIDTRDACSALGPSALRPTGAVAYAGVLQEAGEHQSVFLRTIEKKICLDASIIILN
jgi:predicted RNA binding protein YcfA (HicA-like mRNA interferase family)